jgi:hypothetical protein
MAKKKKKLKPIDRGVPEFNGYKLDDYIYCYRAGDKKLSYGRIHMFHPDDNIEPCLTFCCEVVGQYRLTTFDEIIDDPSKKIKDSIMRAIARNNRIK